MIPWKLLDTARVPGSQSELRFYQRDKEFSIRVDGFELMNSRVYTSEDGFSELGCARIEGRKKPRVLIGGLGMGYSLRSALDHLPRNAEVVVAELVPQIVTWNRDYIGHLAGHPLRDSRVQLRELDVGQVLRESRGQFDLIMLDVDNGPEGLTRKANDRLYDRQGIATARDALRPEGVLGYWASGPNQAFARRLRESGLDVKETSLRATKGSRGVKHTIWLAVARNRGSR
jgi:spermidine synthase